MRSFTGEHICQLDLQGTVDYRSLSDGDETLDILCGLKEIHLRKIGTKVASPADKDGVIHFFW